MPEPCKIRTESLSSAKEVVFFSSLFLGFSGFFLVSKRDKDKGRKEGKTEEQGEEETKRRKREEERKRKKLKSERNKFLLRRTYTFFFGMTGCFFDKSSLSCIKS